MSAPPRMPKRTQQGPSHLRFSLARLLPSSQLPVPPWPGPRPCLIAPGAERKYFSALVACRSGLAGTSCNAHPANDKGVVRLTERRGPVGGVTPPPTRSFVARPGTPATRETPPPGPAPDATSRPPTAPRGVPRVTLLFQVKDHHDWSPLSKRSSSARASETAGALSIEDVVAAA